MMQDVIPILQLLNALERDVLFFVVTIAVTGLAGFCVYVMDKHGRRDK
jgi:uncharacterized membrane protein